MSNRYSINSFVSHTVVPCRRSHRNKKFSTKHDRHCTYLSKFIHRWTLRQLAMKRRIRRTATASNGNYIALVYKMCIFIETALVCVVYFCWQRWIPYVGSKQTMFMDSAELPVTSQVCTNVKQLASTTACAWLLTGNRATLGNPVGFWRQLHPKILSRLELLLTMNWIELTWVSLLSTSYSLLW